MNDSTQQNQLTLGDLGSILWRRKVMIISIFTVSVVAAAIVSLLLPKYYKSETLILCIAPESGGSAPPCPRARLPGRSQGPSRG